MLRAAKVATRQSDLEDIVTGPPVRAAFDAEGQPTPAAVGFARKNGVQVTELAEVETPKGRYLAVRRRQRGAAARAVLGSVLAATLRDLTFPKQMDWDACLDDGRGYLPFGRPIRWLLFLYGGRVVPFVIEGTSAQDLATILDTECIAVRAGHHCAQLVVDRFGLTATTRASFYLYNTIQEVARLTEGVETARRILLG